MLTHEVPTHLNSRDALMFGRTASELLIVLMGLVSLYVTIILHLGPPFVHPSITLLWTLASTGGLLIFQPYERRLDGWAVLVIRYLFQPRRMVYRPVGGIRP